MLYHEAVESLWFFSKMVSVLLVSFQPGVALAYNRAAANCVYYSS